MRAAYWEMRRAHLEQFSGQGLTLTEVAKRANLTTITVRRYAELYGLDFGKRRDVRTGPHSLKRQRIFARDERLCELVAQGKTRHECAADLDLPYHTVASIGRSLGLTFAKEWRGQKGPADTDRAVVMEGMYRAGKTLQQIGDIYGVTRERVRQVLSKYQGVSCADGGLHVRALKNREKQIAERERKCFEKRGCSLEQYRYLKSLRRPTLAFSSQRNCARQRGIVWSLKLWEWWQIWQQSGHWTERGRGTGYMMCRFADAGAYEVGNVYIATGVHNGKVQPNNPYRKSHPDFTQTMAALKARRQPLQEAA